MMKNPHTKRAYGQKLRNWSICLAMVALTLCFAQPQSAVALNCSEVGYDFTESGCCFDFWKDFIATTVEAVRITVIAPSFVTSAAGVGGWTAAQVGNVITLTPPTVPTGSGQTQIGKFCINPNGAAPVVFTIEYLEAGVWQCMQVQQIDC